MKSYEGVVNGRIIEARFAQAGKILKVNKLQGDKVNKWDLIAALDRKILQTELDKELADFEKTRADFEGFKSQDLFLKAEKQAQLNASVKSVELAKAKLDQSDLVSPVSGIVIDDGGIVPGIYITPASAAIRILDSESLYFEFEIEQKEVGIFTEPQECTIQFKSMENKIQSKSLPVFSDGKNFTVKVPIPASANILLGMKGNILFNEG